MPINKQKQYEIETEFKFQITKEQFRQALKEKRFSILTMQLIRQMWLFNNVYNNTFEDSTSKFDTISPPLVKFKSRIRSITNLNEIHNNQSTGNSAGTSNTTTYSHCVKYPLGIEGDENSAIECEQEITEREFLKLRKIGSYAGRTITEKLRYFINIKGSEFEELSRHWIITVDIYDDREDVNIEMELMSFINIENRSEEVEKVKEKVGKIRDYLTHI